MSKRMVLITCVRKVMRLKSLGLIDYSLVAGNGSLCKQSYFSFSVNSKCQDYFYVADKGIISSDD